MSNFMCHHVGTHWKLYFRWRSFVCPILSMTFTTMIQPMHCNSSSFKNKTDPCHLFKSSLPAVSLSKAIVSLTIFNLSHFSPLRQLTTVCSVAAFCSFYVDVIPAQLSGSHFLTHESLIPFLDNLSSSTTASPPLYHWTHLQLPAKYEPRTSFCKHILVLLCHTLAYCSECAIHIMHF